MTGSIPSGVLDRLLSALDPQGSFLAVVQDIAHAADTDPEFERALAGCRAWLSRPIDMKSAAVLEGIDLTSIKTTSPDQHPASALFHATAYGIATRMLSDPARFKLVEERLGDATTAAMDLRKFMADHRDFVGELMVEAGLRAGRDPSFRHTINNFLNEAHMDFIKQIGRSPGGRGLKARMKADPRDDKGYGGGGGEPYSTPGTSSEPAGCSIGPNSSDAEVTACLTLMATVVVVAILCGFFC
jgi:hypothetical protein